MLSHDITESLPAVITAGNDSVISVICYNWLAFYHTGLYYE